MSRDPRDWRDQPAPLMAYVSAAASFVAVCIGVGIVGIGGLMALSTWQVDVPEAWLGWMIALLPVVAAGLGLLSAYSAFQDFRVQAARRAAARSGMAAATLCRACGEPIANGPARCPLCGARQSP